MAKYKPFPNTVNKLERAGYEGTDACLETSLFEYGLIWKNHKRKTEHHEKGDVTFVYGVEVSEYESCDYSSFDVAHWSKDDWEKLLNEDWFDMDGMLSFCDMDSKQDLVKSFPASVASAISHHGYENVFGLSYYPIKIKA